MKPSILYTLGITLALASSSFAADAPASAMTTSNAGSGSGGFFIGVDDGPFWLQSLTPSSGAFSAEFKFKTGNAINVPIGVDFGNGASAFLSVGYYTSGFESLTGHYYGGSQSAQCNGDLTFLPIMGNLSYSVKLADGFHWYLGAGAGVVREDAAFSEFDYPSTQSILWGALGAGVHQFGGISNTTWKFGFQAFTGLTFDFNSSVSANVGYRYTYVNGGISVDGSSSGGFNGHTVEAGLTFKF